MAERTPDTRLLACDVIVTRAAQLMQDDAGAPLAMILDRMLTYAAAQAVFSDGSAEAAKLFRHCAEQIENGAFEKVRVHRGDQH